MKTNYLKLLAVATLFAGLAACEQDEIQPMADINVTGVANSSSVTTITYECAAPATATASSKYWATPSYNGAIDCDTTTAWNSGGWAPAWYKIVFNSPRTFTGLHITGVALPAETQSYTITATRTDNSTVTITEDFTIGDLSNWTIGGITDKDFDFGGGMQEFKSVQISIAGYTRSWKAIMEVKLIVPVTVVTDTDGDGVPDAEDAFPNDPSEWADSDGDGVGDNGDAFPLDASEWADSDGDGVGNNSDTFIESDMSAFVSVGGCESGVANQLLGEGATMNDLLNAANSNSQNHGDYVSNVSQLAITWKKAGLITGKDMGKMVSCAARNK